MLCESELPVDQRSIGLNPLEKLVEPVGYTTLATSVNRALPDPGALKADVTLPAACPYCPT